MSERELLFFEEKNIKVVNEKDTIHFNGPEIHYEITNENGIYILYQIDERGNQEYDTKSSSLNNLTIKIMLEICKFEYDMSNYSNILKEKKEIFENHSIDEIEKDIINKYGNLFTINNVQLNKPYIIKNDDNYCSGIYVEDCLYELFLSNNYDAALYFTYNRIKELEGYNNSFNDLVKRGLVESNRYGEFIKDYIIDDSYYNIKKTGLDEKVPQKRDGAKLIQILEGEDVEKYDALLSLAETGGDYNWI